jgi:hypothetical protein
MSLLGPVRRGGVVRGVDVGVLFGTLPLYTAPLSRRLGISQAVGNVVCLLNTLILRVIRLLLIVMPSIQLRSVSDDDS